MRENNKNKKVPVLRIYEALSYHLNCIRASNIGGWKDITKKVHANEIFVSKALG